MSQSRDTIARMLHGSELSRAMMWKEATRPEGRKELDLSFSVTEAAKLVDRSVSALKLAETQGRIPPATVKSNGRRTYSMTMLEAIRAKLGSARRRRPEDPALIVGVQNFKGGVSKTTTTVHLAHYLGLRGYRVLVIDCDSQASTTSMFGYAPDLDLGEEDTIGAVFSARFPNIGLKDVIRSTPWPTIKLAPSNLEVQNTEYELTAQSRSAGGFLDAITVLRRELAKVIDDFDVVLIDPPPAMGYLALNTMTAANGLLIPVPAKNLDFCSTHNFLDMTATIIDLLAEKGLTIEHRFIRVLCTNYSPEKAADREMFGAMLSAYGAQLIQRPILQSDEIKHAAAEYRSVYEIQRPLGARATHERCRANLDAVFEEVETIIRQQWPSQARALARMGRVSEAEAA